MVFLLSLLFGLPLIFVKDNGAAAWHNIIKIWQDYILLVPLFIINHWLLVPKLILRKSYISYFIVVVIVISSFSTGFFLYEKANEYTQGVPRPSQEKQINPPPRPGEERKPERQTPAIPPYANLLFLSLMIVAVDTGLSFSKHWHKSEEDKMRLESENSQVRLSMLQHQINPHFFMNTLNNIYSLIGVNNQRPRVAVMKLSKLMRFLLYENKGGKVPLSKELEFIENFVDLMKLRYDESVNIKFERPEKYEEFEIPSLLFISYIENAFKYGISYQQKSYIHIGFKLANDNLIFTCKNSVNIFNNNPNQFGGIGLQNSKHRLDLLYQDTYHLKIDDTDEVFFVELKIPVK